MATYDELREIVSGVDGGPLRSRIVMAIAIKAQALVDGTPSASQLVWAQEALASPVSKAPEVVNYMVAANSASTVAQIIGASDALIQTNTDSAIDALVS